jgi:hypothetical protein
MHPLTNNIQELLKKLSTMLPIVTIHSSEKHLLKGSEILEWETVTEIDGKPIVAEKTYLWTYPVITSANHYRRLKNRFKKDGIPGVQQYLEWINQLAKGKKMQQQMQAVMTIIKTIAENN